MNQAFFKHIKDQIIHTLQAASQEVHIAMAWFTSEELLYELISCLKRNIKVSLILLDHPTNWMPYAPDFNDFIKAGGKMYLADFSVGFMHHKFCVVDEEVVITGSYNWTHYAERRNVENIVISDDIKLCKQYNKEFSRLKEALTLVDSTPRMSWDDVSYSSNVNFEEINYEIREISRDRHYEVVEVVPKATKNLDKQTEVIDKQEPIKKNPVPAKANTVVQVIEQKQVFKSRYEVGIQSDEDYWQTFIKIGDSLPAVRSMEFYLDNNNAANSVCNICVKDGKHPFGPSVLEESLSSIAQVGKLNSKVELKISLEKNGYLHMEITNKDNGKTLDGSLIEQGLVIVEK